MAQEDSKHLQDLWRRYQTTRMDKYRNELILWYRPMVVVIANKMIKSLPRNTEVDTLISAGIPGLIQALTRFRTESGVTFATYATPRIMGAIVDELREMDHAPRLSRTRQKRLNGARDSLASRLNRPVTDDELQTELNLSADNFYRVAALDLQCLSLDVTLPGRVEFSPSTVGNLLPDRNADSPDGRLQRQDLKKLLVRGLNQIERLIILLYYDEQPVTMKEIAKSVGLSESRVCQMHSALLIRLRSIMAERMDEFFAVG